MNDCKQCEDRFLFFCLGAKIGPEEAFYLYACGPDFTSIMPCKYGKAMTDYSKYISKDILQCEQIKELFMKKKEVDTGPLTVSFWSKLKPES